MSGSEKLIDQVANQIVTDHAQFLKLIGELNLVIPTLPSVPAATASSTPPSPLLLSILQNKTGAPPTIMSAKTTVLLAVSGSINPSMVLTDDPTIAAKIVDILARKNDYDFTRRIVLKTRLLVPGSAIIYWSDICRDPVNPDSGLFLTLGDLLDAGLAFSDLIRSLPSYSYSQLRNVLKFNPADLCKSYKLFNLSHLKQYYNIGYETLAADYSLGMFDYFVNLNLSLANIARIDITISVAINWREHYAKAFEDHNKLLPTQRQSLSNTVARAQLPLDRTMLSDRFKRRQSLSPNKTAALDSPDEWRAYMNLTLDDLYTMEVTRKDIYRWWLEPYNLTMQKFIECLSYNNPKIYKYYTDQSQSSVASSSSSSSSSSSLLSSSKHEATIADATPPVRSPYDDPNDSEDDDDDNVEEDYSSSSSSSSSSSETSRIFAHPKASSSSHKRSKTSSSRNSSKKDSSSSSSYSSSKTSSSTRTKGPQPKSKNDDSKSYLDKF